MKFVITIVLCIIVSGGLRAQAPQGINYQGIARDSEGKPVASRDIAIRVSILNNGADGDIEYAEVHDVMTNQFGLFTIVIGQGESTVSSFEFIGWASGQKWLQIEMDVNGGRSFQLIGSQQLMSVPYALYAQYAGNGYEAGQGISISNNRITNTGDQDNNPTNELNTDVSFGSDHKLRITDAGGTKEADLSSLLGASQNLSNVLSVGNSAGNQNISNLATPINNSDAATKAYVDAHNDNDNDSSNELQDLFLTGNSLKVTNNPSATAIDLSPFMDNTDNQDLDLNASNILSLSGDGTPVDLSPYLDNTDSQSINLNSGTNLLSISGNASTVDLTPYKQTLGTSSVDSDTRNIAISSGNNINLDIRDSDSDASNEIQDLTFNPGTNVLSLSADGTPVDLSSLRQDLSLSGNTLSLSGDATSVDLSGYLDNTDNQNLSLNATTNALTISGGTGVNLGIYKQDLGLSGNTLSLSGDATPVDLSGYLDNTDSQNLNSVLNQGTDAGTKKITNLANPTLAQDAATKSYVDAADASLSSMISTTYAFKTNFSYTNLAGVIVSDITIPFTTEAFDDFNVLSGNNFTAAQAGTYFFVVEGSYSSLTGQISLLYNSVKYPVVMVTPAGGLTDLRYSATFMFKLNPGETVSLIGDNVNLFGQFNGRFYGFKL